MPISQRVPVPANFGDAESFDEMRRNVIALGWLDTPQALPLIGKLWTRTPRTSTELLRLVVATMLFGLLWSTLAIVVAVSTAFGLSIERFGLTNQDWLFTLDRLFWWMLWSWLILAIDLTEWNNPVPLGWNSSPHPNFTARFSAIVDEVNASNNLPDLIEMFLWAPRIFAIALWIALLIASVMIGVAMAWYGFASIADGINWLALAMGFGEPIRIGSGLIVKILLTGAIVIRWSFNALDVSLNAHSDWIRKIYFALEKNAWLALAPLWLVGVSLLTVPTFFAMIQENEIGAFVMILVLVGFSLIHPFRRSLDLADASIQLFIKWQDALTRVYKIWGLQDSLDRAFATHESRNQKRVGGDGAQAVCRNDLVFFEQQVAGTVEFWWCPICHDDHSAFINVATVQGVLDTQMPARIEQEKCTLRVNLLDWRQSNTPPPPLPLNQLWIGTVDDPHEVEWFIAQYNTLQLEQANWVPLKSVRAIIANDSNIDEHTRRQLRAKLANQD